MGTSENVLEEFNTEAFVLFEMMIHIDFFQVTNLMHNSFILYQYICYIIILNMFRAITCLSSGGQIVLLQPLVSGAKALSLSRRNFTFKF